MDFSAFDKPSLRRILSARRNALTEPERTALEEIVLTRLTSLPAWREAAVIGGYMPLRGEPNVLPVWQAAVRAGKTYALPVTLGDPSEGRMLFRATPDFCPSRLVSGRFGIAEPPEGPDFPVLLPRELDGALILVPALGFDREGYRIGYGGGYYDRFLHALAAAGVSVYTVGVCPAVCRVERLPREAHDWAVSTVLSEI